LDNLLLSGAAVAFIVLMDYLPWERARSGSRADGVRAPSGLWPAGSGLDEEENIPTHGFTFREDFNPATGLPMVGGFCGRDLAAKRCGEP
jgi:hypothetical protein